MTTEEKEAMEKEELAMTLREIAEYNLTSTMATNLMQQLIELEKILDVIERR